MPPYFTPGLLSHMQRHAVDIQPFSVASSRGSYLLRYHKHYTTEDLNAIFKPVQANPLKIYKGFIFTIKHHLSNSSRGLHFPSYICL